MNIQVKQPADQVATLKNALKALQPFFDLRDTMPLQYVRAFMLVATDPGHNVTWYANKAGISPSLMARHLEDMRSTDIANRVLGWSSNSSTRGTGASV